MHDIDFWDLIQLLEGLKPIGCKWIFKPRGIQKVIHKDIRHVLLQKGFTQREGIDYNETFSPVSLKDSFRIIMAIVAHFDLKLHQMGVNGEIDETIYMEQP